MAHWTQISRSFGSVEIAAGRIATRILRLHLLAARLLGRRGRRWDILTRRTSITRILECQWTTDPVPAQAGPWRMIG